MNNQNVFTFSIFDRIINPLFVRRVAFTKASVDYFCSVVDSITNA